MDKDWLTISKAARYLRVSSDTLRRWEKRKLLRPHRSPTGWRYYDKKQLDYVFVQKPELGTNKIPHQRVESSPTTEVDTIPIKAPSSVLPRFTILQKLPTILVFLISLNIILILFYLLTLFSTKPLSPVP